MTQDTDPISAHLGLARADFEEEKWGDAIDAFSAVLERASDNIEAHYFRAMAYRNLARYRTLNQDRHWSSAEDDFRWILRRDSLYRDVIYQYALLERYREAFRGAIALGEAQVRLRPDLADARSGLLRLYRVYLNHTTTDESLAWLQAQTSPYAAYAAGEALRRAGRLEEADTVFTRLLTQPLPFPTQPILLSRARLYYQQGQQERAQVFVEQAIAQIDDSLDAALVFDDVKHIIGDDELAQFLALRAPEDHQTFFHTFWVRRNPTPARPFNVRMAEHYRRMLKAEREYAYDGFRFWYSNPDRLGALDFPPAYALNEEFNDKGLIYLRLGEPDDWEAQVSDDMDFRYIRDNFDLYGLPMEASQNAGWLPNESWRYYSPQRMDFHFFLTPGGGSNNWRLTPELRHAEMLESREHWGPIYSELAAAARALNAIKPTQTDYLYATSQDAVSLAEEVTSENLQNLSRDSTFSSSRQSNLRQVDNFSRAYQDFTMFSHRLAEQSRKAVAQGLQIDRHTWAEEVVPLPMPYVPAAFRGADGQTQVEIYFALPIGAITRAADPDAPTVEVEMGIAVYDTTWNAVAQAAEARRLPASQDLSAAIIDFFRLSMPPDSYIISIFSHPTSTRQIGGSTISYRVPDFSTPTLAMSDLVLADYVGPAQASRFDRGDLHISPNPFRRFSIQQPVFVYFELYNLTLDATEQSRFTLEYTLTTENQGRKVLGIFGRKNRMALSVRMDLTSATTSPAEYIEIDMSAVNPGRYTLTVKTTDLLTGATFERTQPVELVQ